jgi:hypothetical protein
VTWLPLIVSPGAPLAQLATPAGFARCLNPQQVAARSGTNLPKHAPAKRRGRPKAGLTHSALDPRPVAMRDLHVTMLSMVQITTTGPSCTNPEHMPWALRIVCSLLPYQNAHAVQPVKQLEEPAELDLTSSKGPCIQGEAVSLGRRLYVRMHCNSLNVCVV